MLLLDNTSVRCKKKKSDLAKEVPLIDSPCYYEKISGSAFRGTSLQETPFP